MTPRLRRQLWVVLALTVFGLVRGTFWAATMTTPSPIDEMQHFDYVRSLARGEGVPTVGEDLVAAEVLGVAKQSPTFFFRSYPYPADENAEEWQGARPQYEGIQGPVYYALLTPFYWAGRPWGTMGSFYLVRVGSALLGALCIPAAWLLTRRLVPHRPDLWLLPPLVLASINAVSAGAAAIGNDVIVLTGGPLAAILVLWGLERRTVKSAIVAGLVAGGVLVGKTTALALVPILGLLALPSLVRWGRDHLGGALRWTAAYGAAFAAPMVAWTAWNLSAYGAISAAAEADKITGPLQQTYPRSLGTLKMQWFAMRRGFWAGQLNDVVPTYGHTWELVAIVAIAVGLAVAILRRDRTGWSIGWGALAYPLTFVAVAGFFLLAFGESGTILGRYAWAALVPLAIAIGLAVGVVGGRRLGLSLCLLVCAVMLGREVQVTHRFVQAAYEQPVADPGLGPVIEQSWNDGYTKADAILLDTDCETYLVDLGLQEPPDTLVVETATGPVGATLEIAEVAQYARYRLAEPVRGSLEIPVSTGVAISLAEREPAGSLRGGEGDPLVRVMCPVEDPRALRFERLFPEGHPPLERWMLYAWPVVWVVLAAFATLAALVTAALSIRRGTAEAADATVSSRR